MLRKEKEFPITRLLKLLPTEFFSFLGTMITDETVVQVKTYFLQ